MHIDYISFIKGNSFSYAFEGVNSCKPNHRFGHSFKEEI